MIEVTIVNDSRQAGCEADCGIDWSTREAKELAETRLKERFGTDVKLNYLDLAHTDANQVMREWEERISNKSLLPPLLLVNGQLRISGIFDIRQLLDIIEVELELGGSR